MHFFCKKKNYTNLDVLRCPVHPEHLRIFGKWLSVYVRHFFFKYYMQTIASYFMNFIISFTLEKIWDYELLVESIRKVALSPYFWVFLIIQISASAGCYHTKIYIRDINHKVKYWFMFWVHSISGGVECCFFCYICSIYLRFYYMKLHEN